MGEVRETGDVRAALAPVSGDTGQSRDAAHRSPNEGAFDGAASTTYGGIPRGAESHRDLMDGLLAEKSVDPRARAAWRSWLSALATDAEAAMAAALAYESLDGAARWAWLDVLEQDAPALNVPKLALYAPLLSVESDSERVARMRRAIAPESLQVAGNDDILALRGVDPQGACMVAVVSPAYLDFVHVLLCRYSKEEGFSSVRHQQLRHVDEVEFVHGVEVDGVVLEETPLPVVVEELALAILAERRAARPLPRELASFAHLFGPNLDHGGASDANLDDVGADEGNFVRS